MGCFSFICKESGKAALSTSFDGSPVHMFLLENGKVIEHMYGNYDSYGRVFKKVKDENDKSQTNYSSFEWAKNWDAVCALMFDRDKSNGIALILESEWKDGDPYPTTRSKSDPNQGWGSEDEDCCFGSCDSNRFPKVTEPFHKIV